MSLLVLSLAIAMLLVVAVDGNVCKPPHFKDPKWRSCDKKRMEGFYWDEKYKKCMFYRHNVCGTLYGNLYSTPTECQRHCGTNKDEPNNDKKAQPHCKIDGILYGIGAIVPSKNDFDYCKCGMKGVLCAPRPCSVTCKVHVSGKFKEFKDGDKWPAPDGCNSCVCRCGQPFCTVSDCAEKESCVDTINGAIHPHGSIWSCTDGCNTCSCGNGMVWSTLVGCLGKKECIDPFNKKIHASGSYYKSGDGCNSCRCNDGYPRCTAMDCRKDKSCKDPRTSTVHASGSVWRSVDGCNMCRCHNGQSTCTAMDCTIDSPCNDPNTGKVISDFPIDSKDVCGSCTCSDGSLQCDNKFSKWLCGHDLRKKLSMKMYKSHW